MEYINRQTLRQKIKNYRHQPLSLIIYAAVCLSALITAGVVLFLIGYILYHGVPNLTLPGLFAWDFNAENQSMMPAIINTLIMIVLTLLLAVPIGAFAAIYLVEYSKRGNKLVKVIRITAETLSVHCIRTLRIYSLRNNSWLEFHPPFRGNNHGYNDTPVNNENHRGSPYGRSGFFPGGKLRTGSGKTSDSF